MKKRAWISQITQVEKNKLKTYGIDQEEIISLFSYEEMIYLLMFGKKPSTIDSNMLRAVILSHCSHGITGQSTMAVRMAADCGTSFINAVSGGFLVGSGVLHQGSLEATMKELRLAHDSGNITAYIEKKLENKEYIFGFGHRFHDRDPRARTLMKLCKKNSYKGLYVNTAKQIDSILFRKKGIRMNIEAAGGSILLDMGFPPEVSSLIILVGRGPMLAAAYMERIMSTSTPFQKIEVSDIIENSKKREGYV